MLNTMFQNMGMACDSTTSLGNAMSGYGLHVGTCHHSCVNLWMSGKFRFGAAGAPIDYATGMPKTITMPDFDSNGAPVLSTLTPEFVAMTDKKACCEACDNQLGEATDAEWTNGGETKGCGNSALYTTANVGSSAGGTANAQGFSPCTWGVTGDTA